MLKETVDKKRTSDATAHFCSESVSSHLTVTSRITVQVALWQPKRYQSSSEPFFVVQFERYPRKWFFGCTGEEQPKNED